MYLLIMKFDREDIPLTFRAPKMVIPEASCRQSQLSSVSSILQKHRSCGVGFDPLNTAVCIYIGDQK